MALSREILSTERLVLTRSIVYIQEQLIVA
jgi:hypothetical protein